MKNIYSSTVKAVIFIFFLLVCTLSIAVSYTEMKYTVFIFVIFSLFSWSFITLFLSGKSKLIMQLILFFIGCIILYTVIFLYTWGFEIILEIKLNSFDTNGDTMFSSIEQTSEQKKYFDMTINDLGRNLMVFYGIGWSIISTLFYFIIYKIRKILLKLRIKKDT